MIHRRLLSVAMLLVLTACIVSIGDSLFATSGRNCSGCGALIPLTDVCEDPYLIRHKWHCSACHVDEVEYRMKADGSLLAKRVDATE